MLPSVTKTMLLHSTILVGFASFALPASAQQSSATQPATAPGSVSNTAPGSASIGSAEATPTDPSDQTITVTGSLIRNPNLARSTPVTVTTSDEIELRQSNVAEDVLREIPGIVPSIGSAVNNGNGGASYADLRGLGPNRNLVLLNGNRIVPSDTVGRVDLNNIPLALVSRVENLTGSASTTYGADAVAGVINFITKQDFTGVDISGSEQITGKGDGNYYRTDMTIGGNFANDKGNAVLSIGYQHADPVYQGDRDFSVNSLNSYTSAPPIGGSSTSVPTRFSGTRPVVNGVPNTTPAFTQTGVAADGTPILTPVPGGAANNGSRYINPTTGLATIASSPFNFNPYNLFQTPFERYNIFAQAKYDVSDGIELYTRGLFSKNVVNTIIAPSGVFGTSVVIPLSNPYLPAGLRNQLCAVNTAPTVNGTNSATGKPTSAQTTYTPLLTQAQCDAAATAQPTIKDPVTGKTVTNPNYQTVNSTIQRRLIEGGPRISQYTTQVFDYRLGVRGSISPHLSYDVNGSYGESENRQAISGYAGTSLVRDALLATNTTTCISGNAGCVPLNIFGPAGSITPTMVSSIVEPSSVVNRATIAQAHAQLSGDFGYTSPFGTDPVSFAVGSEYRKYTASQDPDKQAATAGELGGAGGAFTRYFGGYNVVEGFGELVAPIVQGKRFFENLTLEAGGRYSSYKTSSGRSYNTTTYKGGGTYEPFSGLKFRGNYSHAVRAPNINELFSPINTVLTNLAVDPCSGTAPLGNVNLRAVCLAQGAPAGQIGNILNPTANQANSRQGGNPLLRPESADTITIGTVFQPTFFRGFSITVDYYNIKIANAITSATTNDVINGCFANLTAASASNPACLSFQRDPVTGRLDGDPATTGGLFQQLSNQGRIKTNGIDLTANYSRDVGIAKLGLSFLGTYVFHNQFQATPVSINRECVGYYSSNCPPSYSGSLIPKFQFSQRTTLGFDSFDVSVLYRHIDPLDQEPLDLIASGPTYPGFNHIRAYNYFDLTGRVNVAEHLTLTLTVQNLTDQRPPIVGSTIGQTAFNNGNTYPSTYDALGRRYAVSARVRF